MEDLLNALLPIYKTSNTSGDEVVVEKNFSIGSCSAMLLLAVIGFAAGFLV